MDEHTAVPDMLLIGEHNWDKLKEIEHLWVKQASISSYKKMITLWKTAEQEALTAIT